MSNSFRQTLLAVAIPGLLAIARAAQDYLDMPEDAPGEFMGTYWNTLVWALKDFEAGQ